MPTAQCSSCSRAAGSSLAPSAQTPFYWASDLVIAADPLATASGLCGVPCEGLAVPSPLLQRRCMWTCARPTSTRSRMSTGESRCRCGVQHRAFGESRCRCGVHSAAAGWLRLTATSRVADTTLAMNVSAPPGVSAAQLVPRTLIACLTLSFIGVMECAVVLGSAFLSDYPRVQQQVCGSPFARSPTLPHLPSRPFPLSLPPSAPGKAPARTNALGRPSRPPVRQLH